MISESAEIWRNRGLAPLRRLSTSASSERRAHRLDVPADARAQMDIEVGEVEVGTYWARAAINADSAGALLSAYVSKPGVVTVVATNLTHKAITLRGVFTVECGAA
jgi:hypothetical protein